MSPLVVVTVVVAAVIVVVRGQRAFTDHPRPFGGVSRRPLEREDAHFIHREGPGDFFNLRTLSLKDPGHRIHNPPRLAPSRPPSGVPRPRPGSLSGPIDGFRPRPRPHPPPHPPHHHGATPPPPQPHRKTKGGFYTTSVNEHTGEGPGGCQTKEGFFFAGQTWYSKGCRRRTCIHFRGKFLTETDSCDSEIFNTTYKCVVQVDTTADFPRCCPTYHCNQDNLGNSV